MEEGGRAEGGVMCTPEEEQSTGSQQPDGVREHRSDEK